MNLLNDTLNLAKEPNLNVTAVCRSAKVSTRWFYKLINGEMTDPGVNRVQRLHDVLTDRKSA